MTEQVATFGFLDEGKRVAVATLTREKPLNSLLLKTIDQLSEHIYAWLADDSIACIVLDSSSPRAFCAGADITALYHSIRESDADANPYAEAFFTREYRLDYALHTASKPIVVWGHGIVMGGGLGLLGGCSHRIGTPATRIAMPEITIGLFPDAGGSWFLSQMPGQLGAFAGLTGCQLTAGDALELGLIDCVVDEQAKPVLFKELTALDWSSDPDVNHQLLNAMLEPHNLTTPLPRQLTRLAPQINRWMQHCQQGDFFETFDAGASVTDEPELAGDEWFNAAMASYRSGSPTTARIFFEQLSRAAGMTLAEMFRMELVIAFQCIRHADFPEGVRALLIDKDKNPAWHFKTAAEIPDSYIEGHFLPVWHSEHPLEQLGES